MKIKKCITCNAEFSPASNVQKYCKGCKNKFSKDRQKTWYSENKERLIEKNKVWRENNKDKVKESSRNYYIENIDKRYKVRGYMLNGNPFTTSDYKDFLIRQNNRCAGCGVCFSTIDSSQACVDHCHTTQEVRGILCRYCNLALGYAKDNVQTLLSLVKYLEANK